MERGCYIAFEGSEGSGKSTHARRVAVEHNLVIVKRAVFDEVVIRDGDVVEVVNFVGGGGGVGAVQGAG